MDPDHQRHELTDFQKGEIQALQPFLSHREIAAELGIPRTTIISFLSRTKERESINNLPHSGRPHKTSLSDDRYIVRTAELQTHVPLTELRTDIGLNVCDQTIHGRLRESGIRKRKALNRPLLSEKHAAKRRKWAREHQHWTIDDWRKVAWSDECAVQRDSDIRKLWVFRRQTKSGKYVLKNIRGKSKGGGILHMIWACFVGNKLGPIAFLNGSVNAQVYIDVLANKFLPFIDVLNADSISNIVFQ